MKKRFFFAAIMLLATPGAFAQSNGIDGITEATNMVTYYFDLGIKLIYAIGAMDGLIGVVEGFFKVYSGDPPPTHPPAHGVCCSVVLKVAAKILRSFFL